METVTIHGKEFEVVDGNVCGLQDGFSVDYSAGYAYEAGIWQASYITEAVCIRSKESESPDRAWDNLMSKVVLALKDLTLAEEVNL